jgi:hypothetical protein
MKSKFLAKFTSLFIFLAVLGPVFPAPANALSLGSGNCASTYTQTSGTFTATATQSGSNCIVIFRTVADNTSSASGTWTLPAGTYSVQYLIVGGGGSSSRGVCSYYWGTGGGGGEVLSGSTSMTGSISVTVGKGGVDKSSNCSTLGNSPSGANGASSVLASITARGGSGGTGGAVGGASGNLKAGGTGNGGTYGCPDPSFCNAGGGGGAASAGSGINAGNGTSSSLSGTLTVYGAGGAGRGNTVFGTSESTCAGTSSRFDAVMHTGCGGSDAGSAMGSGGSGIVVAVYAFDSTPPSFTNSTSFSYLENSAISTNAATITTNESSTITINSGNDGAQFSVAFSDSVTARIRFSVSPNFESPSDVDTNNVYEISVRATDIYGNYANQSIAITVTNVNEAPAITTNSSATTHSVTQAENSSSVITYAATDVDAGTSLTWSISGTDAADFSIAGSGALSFASNPDYEAPADSDTNNSYTVVVIVSDGSLTDTQTITIAITNANENASVDAPTISGTIYKGVTSTITVTINVSGKVRFFVGGKRISTCKDRVTSGTYPNNSATCLWKPPVTGKQILTATLTPTDNTFATSTSAATEVFVRKRSNSR